MEELIKQQLVEKFLSIKESDHERYIELLKQLSDYYSAQCSFWVTLLVVAFILGAIAFFVGVAITDSATSEEKCTTGLNLIIVSVVLLPVVFICGEMADKYNSKSKVPEAAFLIEYQK